MDRIAFLGHATILIDCDGRRLLTDPVLRPRVVHLRRQVPPAEPSLIADLDAVLISHLHHDHLDLASLRLLGRAVPIFVPEGAGTWLRRRRFSDVRELPLGAIAQIGPLAITAVQARHDGHRAGGPRAAAIGYLVSGSRAVYFAGDTELFPEMSGLCAQLDVALLPVSGWGPRLGRGHMGPLEAARAASLLKPRIAIPIHWGTLQAPALRRTQRARLAAAPRLFAEELARLDPAVEVQVLAPGQQTPL